MSATAALISLQEQLSQLTAPAAEPFLQRAALLLGLKAPHLALHDAQTALLTEPGHPLAQALFCQIAASVGGAAAAEAESCALDLLASPFATLSERRAALVALAPERLPICLTMAGPATLRLTLVQRSTDRLTLTGLSADDTPEPLGRFNLRGTDGVALDYHIPRPPEGTRQITVSLNGEERSIALSSAPKAPPRDAPARDTPPRAEIAPLWIVMPVKDGGAVLERCLASVRAALPQLPGARLILVDDCSTTGQCRKLLKDQARAPDTLLLHTGQPLGFTGAVNLGLSAVGRGPVLLLNSDIWLPAAVLPRLVAHLAQAPDIGTVTPLSNNAGGLSLLGPGQSCALPAPLICTRLAEAAWQLHPGQAIDLPNGNGFCMLISEACLAAVGPLSSHYESGYYEEVDFCLRAGLLGFRHLAALDCFVGHAGSVSYGAEKHRLVSVNRRRLHHRFPEYAASYARFAAIDPLAPARSAICAALAPDWAPQADVPSHPGLAARDARPLDLTLPHDPSAPLLLPVRGQPLPQPIPPLADRALSHGLRLIPEGALTAAGLTLRAAHPFWAEYDGARLRLQPKAHTAAAAMDVSINPRSAVAEDWARFAAALLARVAPPHATALPLADQAATQGHADAASL